MSRDSEHRLAMRRNLVSSLFEHERISTTLQKAKEVRPFAEKLITLAKKGNLAARRRAITLLGDRDIVNYDQGKTEKKGTVVGKLFSDIGPRYLDRSGGYTRIVKLALRRLGDNGQVVLLQLLGKDEESVKKSKTASKKKTTQKAEHLTKDRVTMEEVPGSEDIDEKEQVESGVSQNEPDEQEEAKTEQ